MQPAITCINLAGVPRSVQLLKMNGFNMTDDEEGSVPSTTASAGGYVWVIDYYPGEWDSGDCCCWVMLRITLASETNGLVAATVAGRLVDHQHGRLGPRHVPTGSVRLGKGQAMDFFVMSRPELFRSGYVHDDSFLLELEITVGEPKGATAAAASGNVAGAPSSDLHRYFGELWQSQRGADVTFVVSGERITAHRCVLARSPVFKVELFGEMKETASPSVEIEDMEPEVFRALMHFIYTDTSPELDGQGEEAKTMAQHLLAAADRYGMERLKLICEDIVCGDVSVDTAASHLVLAEQHGCPRLKARCMEFMVATPASVQAAIKTDGYKYLIASCPSVLSDLLVAAVGGRYK